MKFNFAIFTYLSGSIGQGLTKETDTTDSYGKASTQLRLGDIPSEYRVTATCSKCIPEFSSVTFTCCGRLRTTTYRQNDPPWGDVILGSHPPHYYIRQTGCALTSVANLINFFAETSTGIARTDPLALNQIFISSGVYNRNDDIRWYKIPSIISHIRQAGAMNVGEEYSREDLITIANEYLIRKLPVIIYIRKNNGRDHFMLVVGRCGNEYIVIDPSPPQGQGVVRRYNPYDSNLLLMGVRLYEPQ